MLRMLRTAVAKLAQGSFPWYWKLQRKKNEIRKHTYLGDPCYVLWYSFYFASASNFSSLSWLLFWKMKYVYPRWKAKQNKTHKQTEKEAKNPTRNQSKGRKRNQIKLLANCGDFLKLSCIAVYRNLHMLQVSLFVCIVHILYISDVLLAVNHLQAKIFSNISDVPWV